MDSSSVDGDIIIGNNARFTQGFHYKAAVAAENELTFTKESAFFIFAYGRY